MRRRRPLADEHAQHQASGDRFFQCLDFSHANSYRKGVVLADHDVRSGSTVLLRARDRLLSNVLKVGHVCCYFSVPPTVISRILIVGKPTLTGIVWPSLPQIPTPWSSFKSLPTAVTCRRTVGPSPISVAPLTGAVRCPSSI